jgi:hypothetical protein
VTLAKCLAAVAEWVGRAPRTGTPSVRALSAMVESSGSPLVRRVGRILGERVAPRRRTSHIAFASATFALLVVAAALPRVSIAKPSPGPLAFLRMRGAVQGMVIGRDRVLVRQIGTARLALDSIAGRTGGAVAGTVRATEDVIVQRFVIDTAGMVDTGEPERHLRSAPPANYDPANDLRPRR